MSTGKMTWVHRGGCLTWWRQSIFALSLSYYAKCLARMHCSLETKIDMHSTHSEPFFLLHTPVGVSLRLDWTALNTKTQDISSLQKVINSTRLH
jgi:hypothetical protein